MKRILVSIAALVVLAAVYFFSLRPAEPSVPTERARGAVPHPRDDSSKPATVEIENLNLAADLNASSKTIRNDLETLNSVFLVWQTNFLHTGNPVGENAEITAALTGRNALHVAFISPKNPAINGRGELCDRWGTPFFFHQLSGTRMEIVSAGPDRRRGTADDVVFTP